MSCCRAAGGGDARAAAMLKRVRAGLVGLPPPQVAAHSPREELVFSGVCRGCGGKAVPAAGSHSAGGRLA